jgi:glycerol-3-phosphate dehydrogenase
MGIYDVLIIGGGVVGCSIARKLSRYRLKTVILERECDVGMGASGRNSGVAHAGFYVKPGTLKAKTNINGHRKLPELCRELDVPYEEIGKLVVAKNEDEVPYLEKLKSAGERNGTRGLRIIEREEVKRMEPKIEAFAALYSPTSAILDPFELTIALAENAMKNGARFSLNSEVLGISRKNGSFLVRTKRKEFSTKVVINSAGLYSDKIAGMVGIDRYRIHPCRGEYHILDKNKKGLVNHLIYPVPPKDVGGLGVHLTPTVDGNIMIGPSADYIQEIDVSTTLGVMNLLLREAKELLPEISQRDFIRSFAGIRAKLTPEGSEKPADFVIEEDPEISGFVNLVGIESPGLTAAPAIAGMVVDIIKKSTELRPNNGFDPVRKGTVRFSKLPDGEKGILVEKNLDYGRIVCRCEEVTKKEILDALENPLHVKNVDSLKRRCRAGAGRCQGSFCLPKIVEILEEHHDFDTREMRLNCEGSELFVGRARDLRKNEGKGG